MSEARDQARALADRLVNYADTIVAVAFVGVSGLGLAVADPDTRGDIARVAHWVLVSNIILGILSTWFILVLRRWELKLRSKLEQDETAQRISTRLHWARLVVVWIAVAQTIALMLAIG